MDGHSDIENTHQETRVPGSGEDSVTQANGETIAASPFADPRGHHVAVRATSLEEAREFYVGKLDLRVVAEWPFADEQLAYLAPPNDDHFLMELLGGGDKLPAEVRSYKELGGQPEIQRISPLLPQGCQRG